MHVAELWRHPVKSLQGEPRDEVVVEDSGLSGDRQWGIVDCETGIVLTARRVPSLLLASSRLTDTGVELVLPDGDVLTAPSVQADNALSKWIGRRVALVSAESIEVGTGEYFEDATDDNSAGHLVDNANGPLRRRAPAVSHDDREPAPGPCPTPRRCMGDTPVPAQHRCRRRGRRLGRGRVVRTHGPRRYRCIATGRSVRALHDGDAAEPGLDRDLDVFKVLARRHGATFGVWTTVQTTGVVRVGDEVTVTD